MTDKHQSIALADAVSSLIDYRGKTPTKTAYGIPLITAKIVKNGRIDTPKEFIAPSDYEAWMRRGIPHEGDVVITTEAPLGEVAQLPAGRLALAQRLICLRGKPHILDNTYLKYALQSEPLREEIQSRASGTTVLGIKQSELRKIILHLPPLPEQKRIAHILSSLDEKIELNRQMNETLEAMAQALFQDWFVDFGPTRAQMEGRDPYLAPEIWELFPDTLGEDGVPEGWEQSTIGEEVTIAGGGTPSTKTPEFWEEGQHYWATPKDMSGLTSPTLLSTQRRITDAGLAKLSSGLLPKGALLLSSRAPIGYLAITEVPTAINQGIIGLVCDGRLSNEFMLQWCKAHMDTIISKANGSTFLEISRSNFRPIAIDVAPLAILNSFDSITSCQRSQIVANRTESKRLANTRDVLLREFFES